MTMHITIKRAILHDDLLTGDSSAHYVLVQIPEADHINIQTYDTHCGLNSLNICVPLAVIMWGVNPLPITLNTVELHQSF